MIKNYLSRLSTKLSRFISVSTWANTLSVLKKDKITVFWWRGEGDRNWGDKVNKYLVETISHKEVVHADDVFQSHKLNVYSCVGSIIKFLNYDNVIIWGSGIIKKDSYLKIKPKKINAVRGPLTRQKLLDEGYDCPEVYGDPVLLLPRFYSPDVTKKYELGVIPHYIDQRHPLVENFESEDILIIDVFGGVLEFVDDVNRCRNIVSSSLHGLIVADAYGIPSKWVEISDLIVGNGFKYRDYYESIGVSGEEPFKLNNRVSQQDLVNQCWKKEIKLDLDTLLNACPFYEN